MASDTGAQPSHLVTLTDGSATVGLMAGTSKKKSVQAIRRLPRGPGVERKAVRQTSWHGGRGNEIFSRDTTRFFDSSSMWSMVNDQLTLGPLMRFSRGHRNNVAYWPGDTISSGVRRKFFRWFPLTTTTGQAVQLTPAANFSADKAYIIARRLTGSATLTVKLYTDSAGAPNTELKSVTVSVGSTIEIPINLLIPDWTTTQALTGGTAYWLGFLVNGAGWEIGVDADPSDTARCASHNGSAWSAPGSVVPYAVVSDADPVDRRVHFFEYKRQLYAATEPLDGSAGVIYQNGDRGVATGAQTTNTLKDSTKTWTASEWINNTVLAVAGPNKGQWRRITANTTDTLTVSPAWVTAPTAGASGTEYVILGSDKWTAITITLSAAVTGVAVMNNIVYVAMGEAVTMRRYRAYNNSGTWDEDDADDGANTAHHLLMHQDGSGETRMYRTKKFTATANRASSVAWGVNLSFNASDTKVGSEHVPINSITRYDNEVYVGKQDEIRVLKNNPTNPTGAMLAQEVPVPMGLVWDEHNCQSMKQWNTNLYFSFMDGFERLYGQVIDDIGPNRDQGLPQTRRGFVADFVPVLNYGYVALDNESLDLTGALEGFSAILATTSPGGDWHELFRGLYARRIRDLFYQTVPSSFNKLWFSHGTDICYLVMPDDTHNPRNDANMLYSWAGYIESSWMDLDSPELDHYFNELRLLSQDIDSSLGAESAVRLFYELDTNESISDLDSSFTTSPFQAVTLAASAAHLTGRRIRIKYDFDNETNLNESIIVFSTELRANQMNEVLYDYIFSVGLEDRLMLLSGGDDVANSAAAAIAQLAAWQEDATPLTLTCVIPAFTGKLGHIDPVALVADTYSPTKVAYTGSITFKET